MNKKSWLKSFGKLAAAAGLGRKPRPAERPKAARTWRRVLEVLEDRLAPAFYAVTSLNEGTGSVDAAHAGTQQDPFLATTLRAAVKAANAASDADTITFAPTLFTGGPGTLTLSTAGDNTFGPSDFGITTTIAIVGPTGDNGLTLAHNGVTQRFFYVGPTGGLTLRRLTVAGGTARGGDGGLGYGGGGGGAGLGGAAFVDGGGGGISGGQAGAGGFAAGAALSGFANVVVGGGAGLGGRCLATAAPSFSPTSRSSTTAWPAAKAA